MVHFESVTPNDLHHEDVQDPLEALRATPYATLENNEKSLSGGAVRMLGVNPINGPALAEATRAIVRLPPLPGNAFDPQHRIHAHPLAAVTGLPVISISAPSKGTRYHLSFGDRRKIAAGDFGPLGREIYDEFGDMIEKQGLTKLAKVAIIGHSLGAAVGARLARDWDVTAVGAAAPPNTQESSLRKLFARLNATKPQDYTRALLDSPIAEHYCTAFGIPQRNSDTQKLMTKRMNPAGHFAAHPWTNLALARGLTHGSFGRDAELLVRRGVPLTIGYGNQDQLVSIESPIHDQQPFGDKVSFVRYEGNHAIWDNPAVYGHFALRTLSRAAEG